MGMTKLGENMIKKLPKMAVTTFVNNYQSHYHTNKSYNNYYNTFLVK